jgi:hypothetical protein
MNLTPKQHDRMHRSSKKRLPATYLCVPCTSSNYYLSSYKAIEVSLLNHGLSLHHLVHDAAAAHNFKGSDLQAALHLIQSGCKGCVVCNGAVANEHGSRPLCRDPHLPVMLTFALSHAHRPPPVPLVAMLWSAHQTCQVASLYFKGGCRVLYLIGSNRDI